MMQSNFRGILAALVLSFAFTMDAAAGPLRNLFAPKATCKGGNCSQAPRQAAPAVTVATTATSTVETVKTTSSESVAVTVGSTGPIRESLAQMKANTQARLGRMFHPGGGFGAGRYEGVGFSTVSAAHAISMCCYHGQKTPIDIGVARGARGWYAAQIYK